MRGAGPRRGFSILELMIVVAIVGILAAIAVPNFMRFQARAKQSEAKGQLKAIFTGERTRFGEKDAFSPFVQDLGFAPERGNRYAYRLSAGCAHPEVRGAGAIANATPGTVDCIQVDQGKYPGALGLPPTVGGVPVWLPPANNPSVPANISDAVTQLPSCPLCSFSVSAAGNVDFDSTIDVWYVASVEAVVAPGVCWEGSPPGGNVGAGQPFNLNNDVGC